jgi:hypothetical protein
MHVAYIGEVRRSSLSSETCLLSLTCIVVFSHGPSRQIHGHRLKSGHGHFVAMPYGHSCRQAPCVGAYKFARNGTVRMSKAGFKMADELRKRSFFFYLARNICGVAPARICGSGPLHAPPPFPFLRLIAGGMVRRPGGHAEA